MMNVLGIAGTAKNTGKTTTTTILLDYVRGKAKLGLTTIGYDGEAVDNVTGLPKPRIIAKTGDLVAVAEGCITLSTAQVEIKKRTPIATPLGKIVIGEVTEAGRLVIAGPNKSAHLKDIIRMMQDMGAEFTIIDGALSRMAPIVETDGFILATGAARHTDLNLLARETSAIADICKPKPSTCHFAGETVTLLSGDCQVLISLPIKSLLTLDNVLFICSRINSLVKYIYIPGIISDLCFRHLLEQVDWAGRTLVMADPIKLVVVGDVLVTHQRIAALRQQGGSLETEKQVPLLAVTINPFFPRFRFDYQNYTPDYVDKDLLRSIISQAVTVPVLNVLEDSPETLGRILTEK